MAYASTTRAELRQKVRDRLIAQFWVDDELNRLINESIRVWNVLTAYHRQQTTVTIGVNTIFYDLNANISNHMWLMRIEFNDYDTHPEMASLSEMDKMRALWMCDTGKIQRVIPIGLNVVAFWPRPETAISATIESVRTAVLPNADGDFINVGNEDLAALIAYCHFAAVLKEGGKELQDAFPSLQYFLTQAAKHNAKLNTISVFRKLLGFGGQKSTRPNYADRTSPRGQDPQQ